MLISIAPPKNLKATREVLDLALRLARYLGTSAEFWLGLQSDYDLEKAKDELATKIAREVQPRKRSVKSPVGPMPFSTCGI